MIEPCCKSKRDLLRILAMSDYGTVENVLEILYRRQERQRDFLVSLNDQTGSARPLQNRPVLPG
jgi:hypothetical protein